MVSESENADKLWEPSSQRFNVLYNSQEGQQRFWPVWLTHLSQDEQQNSKLIVDMVGNNEGHLRYYTDYLTDLLELIRADMQKHARNFAVSSDFDVKLEIKVAKINLSTDQVIFFTKQFRPQTASKLYAISARVFERNTLYALQKIEKTFVVEGQDKYLGGFLLKPYYTR